MYILEKVHIRQIELISCKHIDKRNGLKFPSYLPGEHK